MVAGLAIGIATNSCKTTACCYKHAQMLRVYAYVVLQDSDRDSSFIGSLKALIIIEKTDLTLF